MLSNGQPIEQAPHSMQFPKLTRFFFCSSFHSQTPAGQKCVQYFPVHFERQTSWSTISMCGLPVSSLYLTVKSLSVSFSMAAPSLEGDLLNALSPALPPSGARVTRFRLDYEAPNRSQIRHINRIVLM